MSKVNPNATSPLIQWPIKPFSFSNTQPTQPNSETNFVTPFLGEQFQFSGLGSANTSLSFDEQTTPVSHLVKKGQSLSEIAKEYLGDSSRYMEIYEANKEALRNPNDLRVGMSLVIPGATSESANLSTRPQPRPANLTPAPPEYTNHTVKRGESLSIISLRLLGNAERYMEIFEANQDILKSPGNLKVGMTLKIPTGSSQGQSSVEATSPIRELSINDARGLTDGAKELLSAMQGYQDYHNGVGNTKRTRTTSAEMREIAIELDRASKAFGVDPKMMLAVFAHESGGLNPRARSHTGAGGLGQLTGIAIRQVHYMAGMAKGQQGRSPYTQYKSNFVQSTRSINQRYNIKANIWTSTAYMSYELNDRDHLGRGVEKALKRYGDPNVSTYANKVNAEYKTFFGSRLF